MKATSTFLVAAATVGGVSCQRALQGVPVVGVNPNPTSTAILSTASPTDLTSTTTTTTDDEEEELIKALEFDDHVTVVSPVVVGELMCDTLVDAEDAAALSFALLQNENIIAEKSSYSVTSGDAFTDGIGRKVWTGKVTDPAQAEDEGAPRTVSMAWGDVCNTETFLLKVTKWNVDGTTSIVKTIPCYGSTTHTCLVEVEVEFDEPGEGISPAGDASVNVEVSDEEIYEETTYTSSTGVSNASDRRLQDDEDTVIDIMVLYSTDALVAFGGVSSDQMESNIIESIVRTNEAFVNSEVTLHFNAVHIGQLPYDQLSSDTDDSLRTVTFNSEVENLRDSTGADLVQMVGYYNDGFCGRAWLYEGFGEIYGFSVVGATCLADNSVAHEYGHNLGCLHNREIASYQTDYAHGLRYCSGDDPYRTIMSYPCGSPYANYFSNPDVSYLDKPTGTETENNARAIRDNMVDVSNFRATAVEPPTPAPTTEPDTTEYTLVGCYGDDPRDRVLSGDFLKSDNGMTTEVCAAFCEGSTYFGTEYGVECFCSVATDDPFELGGASCNFDCSGDDSQTCGGRNAITVYEYDTIGTPLTFLGCWQDTSTNRVMSVVQTDSSMTNDLCDEICSFYPFYGTQYGRECWCGDDSTDYTKNGASDSCTFDCAGDTSQTCGGFYAISVYEHDTVPPPTGYLGCWKDTKDSRIMDFTNSDSSMTNDLCKDICGSYAFYGTQYGQECWCGDDSTEYTTHGESDSCNIVCTGDASTVCGGRYAMSVWETQ